MRSMTGYGRASSAFGAGVLSLEVRSVNHRFLEVRTRLAPSVIEYASTIESTVRKSLTRGRIEVSARVEGGAYEPTLNRARAKSAFAALQELRDELQPDAPLPLSLLSAVPHLFSDGEVQDPQRLHQEAAQVATLACEQLGAMQEQEGAALATDLQQRAALLIARIGEVEPLVGDVVQAYRKKLHARIDKLLEGASVPTDAQRLEHEIALFADRADVSEELTRLRSHCTQFEALLSEEAGPVGRKLEFLLQEMGREVNTLGSKTPDLGVTRHVIEMKAELERIREQVHNVL